MRQERGNRRKETGRKDRREEKEKEDGGFRRGIQGGGQESD